MIKVIKTHEPVAWRIACSVAAAYLRDEKDHQSAGKDALYRALDQVNRSKCPDCSCQLRPEDMELELIPNGHTEMSAFCPNQKCRSTIFSSIGWPIEDGQ